MSPITLTPPLSENDVRRLRAGDVVAITGRIVTARDRAHARIVSGKRPPLDLEGGIVYHCGPLAKRIREGWRIVSAGPTTSARMERLQAEFVRRTGIRAIVGKGGLGEAAGAVARLGCVYLTFPGGAGALAAESVERVERVYWMDLGEPEAMWVLRVKNFGPLLVAIDTAGNNMYERRARR